MFGIVYPTGSYCLIQLTLLKTNLIDSGKTNLLCMIVKQKLKEREAKVGNRN